MLPSSLSGNHIIMVFPYPVPDWLSVVWPRCG